MKHGLFVERFYKLELTTSELATYPAIYLGMYCTFEVFIQDEETEKVNVTVLNEYEMVQDYDSERIVVSPQVKTVLENMTKGLGWKSIKTTDNKEWFIMEVLEILPQPIIVPSPVSVEQNEESSGSYAVRSDGRDVITKANISKLKEVGIALSLEVQVLSKILKWRPRILASGKVIHALLLAGVKDIVELTVPLLIE